MATERKNPGESLAFLPPDHIQNKDSNFIEFSKIPEYIEENRQSLIPIVEQLPDNFIFVDIASGTGLVPTLVAEEAKKLGKTGIVIGVEPDDFAIRYARENTPSDDKVQVHFVQAAGEHVGNFLDPLKGKVDAVTIHDAFHEVRGSENKRAINQAAYDLLKEGGVYNQTSAFTTEGMGEDETKYGFWLARTFRRLGGRGKRAVEKLQTDEATKIYKPQELAKMMGDAGFSVETTKRVVSLSPEALMAIAVYPRFSEGAIEKFEPNEGVEIPAVDKMGKELALTVRENNIGPLGRVWYTFTGKKVTS